MGVEKAGEKVENEGDAIKCFAKRRRPSTSGAFSQIKWDAMRQAFQQKVQPLLSTYSAHEAHVLRSQSKLVTFMRLIDPGT